MSLMAKINKKLQNFINKKLKEYPEFFEGKIDCSTIKIERTDEGLALVGFGYGDDEVDNIFTNPRGFFRESLQVVGRIVFWERYRYQPQIIWDIKKEFVEKFQKELLELHNSLEGK